MKCNNSTRIKCLIFTGPGIGDMMQHFPMARDIKERYPNARVDFVFRGNKSKFQLNRQIFECQEYADNLFWYSSKTIFHDLKLLCMFLFTKRYDYGFVRFENVSGYVSLWPLRIMKIARCRVIIESGLKGVGNYVEEKGLHYLELHAKWLEAAGIPGRINAKVLNRNKLDNSLSESLLRTDGHKIIGLSLGTNSMEWIEKGETVTYDVKSWPYDRWMDLAERMSLSGYVVLLLGGSKEEREMRRDGIRIPTSARIYNFVNKTAIKQSLSLVSKCDLMVGAEGGLMHSASALGIRTLTIFGGSDPKIWNPGGTKSAYISMRSDCAPCFATARAAHCKEHKCLNDITVEIVEKKIKESFNNDYSTLKLK